MRQRFLRLSDIAAEDRAIVPPNSPDAARRPYLGLEQIEAGTGRILNYDVNSAEGKSTTFAFDDLHVLYGKLRPYLNKVALPDRAGRCSTEIVPLLPVGVDRSLLALVLRTDRVVNGAMSEKTGSRMPRADMDALLSLEISIPALLEEQRRIAARLKAQLTEVDTARQAAQAQSNDIALLRRRMLAEVFAAVEDAPRKRLGDHAPTTSGSTPSRGVKAYWTPAEVPWVKTGEVNFAPITRTEEAVSRTALAECSLTLLPPGSVLVAMYGQGKTRGQSAILEVAATTNQACFAVQPNDTWEPGFLFHWLMAHYHDLRELSEGRGGIQANLNGALLNALEIPAPSRDEQTAIARRAQAALREIETLAATNQAQRADIERLPQRLLAQAFGDTA
jgi:type I restriction enzyme S subunit